MSLTEEMTRRFGADALKRPITAGEVYELLDALKDGLVRLGQRVDALAPSDAKEKARVRVPAGRAEDSL